MTDLAREATDDYGAGLPGKADNSFIRRTMRAVLSRDRYDLASLILLAALVGLVVATFRDYAITNDEWIQHRYGELIVAYYRSGFTDRAVFALDNLYLYGVCSTHGGTARPSRADGHYTCASDVRISASTGRRRACERGVDRARVSGLNRRRGVAVVAQGTAPCSTHSRIFPAARHGRRAVFLIRACARSAEPEAARRRLRLTTGGDRRQVLGLLLAVTSASRSSSVFCRGCRSPRARRAVLSGVADPLRAGAGACLWHHDRDWRGRRCRSSIRFAARFSFASFTTTSALCSTERVRMARSAPLRAIIF